DDGRAVVVALVVVDEAGDAAAVILDALEEEAGVELAGVVLRGERHDGGLTVGRDGVAVEGLERGGGILVAAGETREARQAGDVGAALAAVERADAGGLVHREA